MEITDKFLEKILVGPGIISKKDLEAAGKEAKAKNYPLEDWLLEKGLISDEELGSLMADSLDFPFVNLRKKKIKKEILELIPEKTAKARLAVAFEDGREGLKIAFLDPENMETREFIKRKTGRKILPYFATKKDIEAVLKYYKKGIGEQLKELLKEVKPENPSNLPIAKIVDLILAAGYENRASDVHLEPYRQKTVLRFRIDGILHDILDLPKFLHEPLLSRIKILSKLRTDLHEASQDGHFSLDLPKEKLDIRVSVVPIEEGEKTVLRLLSEGSSREFGLEDLGLGEKDLKIIQKASKSPWGMILISGPAGSGKTTTLYSLLKILNTREVNIMTIEDPIEYDIEGINQIQVNSKTNLTFAEGLKAIVRQNPDIIMVGEIRDKETASLAINAAMTGHLVFSTFHANDSATTLPRLAEMGAEPFLIASTVNIAISQRLIRKICPNCIESYEMSFAKATQLLGKELAGKLPKDKNKKIRLFKGHGCSLCQKTGYLGRVGIFEVLQVTEPIKKLIMANSNASEIKKEAQKEGMITMVEDGLKKAEKGITTLEEILRATKE